ncbi:unnamed protein product [Amoebophrya sp. A25]|nr:unnamed protein product [Amoebophrya sp. A25]|eukprot:GSA25T00000070001.1
MVRLSVTYGDTHDVEKEHILVSHHQTLYYVRTCDYFHTTKPTKQKVPFLCDVGLTVKNEYGRLPRLDQLPEITQLLSIPEKKLLITADQAGTIVITGGPPKMDIIRRVCTGSEIVAMEHVQNKDLKASVKNPEEGVPLLVYAYRSISGVYGDGKSRIRFWNYKSNEMLAEIDLPSELNNILFCAETNQVLCCCRQGKIWKILPEATKGRGLGKPTMEFNWSKTDTLDVGAEGDHLMRLYSLDKSAGVLTVSQQGKLKMWHLAPTAMEYLEVDCLFHVGNCSKASLLHYKRVNPGSVCADDMKRLDLEDGDMLIVGGDELISFINPYDVDRPCIRRLDFREGVRCLTQWRNLVMVGTKSGLIIGIDPFSGVHQLKLQLGLNAEVEQLVGGVDVLRGINSCGRLAVWALKGIDVVRLVELDAPAHVIHNVGASQLPSGHNHLGAGNLEVLRRTEKGQERY